MGQIEMFNNFLYLKLFNCVQTNDWCYIELSILYIELYANKIIVVR